MGDLERGFLFYRLLLLGVEVGNRSIAITANAQSKWRATSDKGLHSDISWTVLEIVERKRTQEMMF